MKIRDVPLAFLPTFEAAGRLGSFAAAASELDLTASAISEQMRDLEDALGFALFDHIGRSFALTQDGEQYLVDVRESLRELAASTARLRRRTKRTPLRVSPLELAAHDFLLPRMATFQELFTDIDLSFDTTSERIEFASSHYDAAIRVAEGFSELVAYPLATLECAVVCSPGLAREIRSVSDLHRYTLLDSSGAAQEQLATLQRNHGLAPLGAARTWVFESCIDGLRAAERGLGVAFAAFPMATPWVESGRLAVPLPERIEIPGQACFVHRAADAGRFPYLEIAEWLAGQYRALPVLPSGRVTSG